MIPDAWDIESRETALATAQCLIETGAVCFDEVHPFTVCSGLTSPIHIDFRRLLSVPQARNHVVELALRVMECEIGGEIDAVAAVEGGGAPFATLIADRLGLPLIHVRKAPPDEWHKRQVEGLVEPGWNVLLVEHLAADGHRKARFAEALQGAGCDVNHALVIFQYGIFDAIHEHLSPLGVTMHYLATWWDLLELANRGHYMNHRILGEIHAFLHDPQHWSERSDTTRVAAAG